MSYILEALKDSQRNRDDHRVPTLLTDQGDTLARDATREAAPIKYWLYVVLLAVAGGGVAGWWFSQDSAPQPRVVMTPPAVTQPAPRVQVEDSKIGVPERSTAEREPPSTASVAVEEPRVVQQTEQPVEQPEASTIPVEPEPEIDLNSAAESITDTGVDQLAVSSETPAIEEPVPVEAIALEAKSDTVFGMASEKAVVEAVAPKPAVEEEAQSPQRLAAAQPEEADAMQEDPAIEEPVPEERIPDYRELPLDIQQNLGRISFSVHFYSPDPKRRLVKINGIVRREGSDIGNDVTLEEITPRGAIFSYRDYRFRVPVL